MDDDFRILFDYVEQMERELQDKADLQTKSAEDEEKKCVHESIETEEAYVCCKCCLVLEDIFQPDIHWCDHALMPRIYGGADRLNAMHKVLIKVLDKISFCTYLPMYTLEERLRDMKIDSGFKSLNYAICVMCILEGDVQAEQQDPSTLAPFRRGLGKKSSFTFTRTRDIREKLAEKSAENNSKRPLRSTEKT